MLAAGSDVVLGPYHLNAPVFVPVDCARIEPYLNGIKILTFQIGLRCSFKTSVLGVGLRQPYILLLFTVKNCNFGI